MERASILIVHGAAVPRGIIAEMLALGGYDTLQADTANEALAALQYQPVAAILVDLPLRVGRDGHVAVDMSAVHTLRTECPGVPIIACCAHPNVIRSARRAGILEVLRKPPRLGDLLDAISRATSAAPS